MILGTLALVGFLAFIYLLIGAFLIANNYDLIKMAYDKDKEAGEEPPPLWLISLLGAIMWPWARFSKVRKEMEEIERGKEEERLQRLTYDPRRGHSEIRGTSGGSGLQLKRSLDEQDRQNVASYFDPYEYANRYESLPMAVQELVGGDDSDRDTSPCVDGFGVERDLPTYWRPSHPETCAMEAPTATPYEGPCFESTPKDSGVGSDSSWSSGSESSSGGYDSGGCSGGGE